MQLDAGGVGFVRVLVTPERDAQHTIIDVRTLALETFRVDIDPARIQVISAGRAPPIQTSARRRRLASLVTERAGGRFRARVVLVKGSDVAEGVGVSSSVRELERRAIAAAILDGTRPLLDPPAELGDVEMLAWGDDRLVVVTVERATRTLIGSAQVTLDENDAIARATLHALNRACGRL
ncbi:hypothetical protein BH24ACT26_BH24ACT26_20750 [soil metagenome]